MDSSRIDGRQPVLKRETWVPNPTIRAFWVVWLVAFVFKLSLIFSLALFSRAERCDRLERSRQLHANQVVVVPFSVVDQRPPGARP